MADLEIDMSEVRTFAADLGRIPAELSRHAIPALKRFAHDVKTDIQADRRGSSNAGFRKIANHVTYDEIGAGSGGWETEVGAEKSGAGNLETLAVFGSYKGGGTHPHPDQIAPWHLPAFEQALGDIAEELI